MTEIYLEIKEWPGYYISNHGRVRHGERVIACCPNKNRRGYVYVYHHSKDMKPRALSVHRLVARYFIPNPESKPQVNHIDCNPQNNRVDNLEWVTASENMQHMIRLGRQARLVGELCGNSVLNEKTVRLIKADIGKMTHRQIAKKYNTNYSNVAHIKRGSRWGHVHI